MIHILYPRVDCLKTIPFTAAHTYIVHIWQYLPRVHTALANFDVILVEKAVVFVLFREVLRNKFEKCSADVSLDVFTERRVVPDNIFFVCCVEVVQVACLCCRSVFPYSRWLSKLSCRLVWPC